MWGLLVFLNVSCLSPTSIIHTAGLTTNLGVYEALGAALHYVLTCICPHACYHLERGTLLWRYS